MQQLFQQWSFGQFFSRATNPRETMRTMRHKLLAKHFTRDKLFRATQTSSLDTTGIMRHLQLKRSGDNAN